MGAKIRKKAIKVVGKQRYLNTQTGELEEMDVITVEERDFNFHKLWLHNLLATVDLIGNQKVKLAFWIIDHLDSENKLIYTFRQMAEETGISLDTVSKTMKALMDCDFLRKKQNGCYIVNPDVLYKGRHQGRMNVLIKYRDTKIKTDKVEIRKRDLFVSINENTLD